MTMNNNINLNTPRKFRIKSPCSTANIGPGFDVLGMSLSLYLTMEVEILPASDKTPSFVMTYSGEGATKVPLTPEKNLITKTALYVLSANGITSLPQPLKIHVDNPIPLGRGLGSSGAAVVGGVLLGNALGQLNLSHDRLLDYCLMIERHPDNVAAALMGGFVASYLRELSPEQMKGVPESETALLNNAVAQRAVPQPPVGIGHYVKLGWNQTSSPLPKQEPSYPHNMKERILLAVLTTALGQVPPNPELIYNAMQDKIHQPYRKTSCQPLRIKKHGDFECFYKVLDVVTDGSTCVDL
ncbi:MAG: homoserine kinase [Benjaminiella poitrasii]|nr:MAG: homoserine kinase [Benjaminiella poitrasii]